MPDTTPPHREGMIWSMACGRLAAALNEKTLTVRLVGSGADLEFAFQWFLFRRWVGDSLLLPTFAEELSAIAISEINVLHRRVD